jgi:hypothetical protein
MAGIRGGLGRVAAMVIALVVLFALLLVESAWAGEYQVAQCGWYAGSEGTWADTTGGAKFRPDAFCAAPVDGSHSKSFTREGVSSVSGTAFARWRWQAPPGTGIRAVSGSWWRAVHDGFEQRLGVDPGDGSFQLFGDGVTTDTTPTAFAVTYPVPKLAFEERLLCAKPANAWCGLEDQSWSGLRGLVLTIEDDWVPVPDANGQVFGGGWRTGVQGMNLWSADIGAGVRSAEVRVDGARVSNVEYPCAVGQVEGVLIGTALAPCPLNPASTATIDTTRLSDGSHLVDVCVWDFAGNPGCMRQTSIIVDNDAPGAPLAMTSAGGDGWRRGDDFDLSWVDPDQGAAAPIWGFFWRITGPGGYDTGTLFSGARGANSLADQAAPAPGEYTLHLWLRDEAGNATPANGVDVPLRWDDVAPAVAFEGREGDEDRVPPGQILAAVVDPLSGPASGTISYRRSDAAAWTDLPTKLVAGDAVGKATLVAPTPTLGEGNWIFRAEASDEAGNAATTSLRGDGTQMAIRMKPAASGGGDGHGVDAAHGGDGPSPRRERTLLFARLSGGSGETLTVPFGAPALLSGRLTDADGAGLAGRRIEVVARPSQGALAKRTDQSLTTGGRGGFTLRLAPGTSRRISVSFAGGDSLAPARHRSLELRVRSGLTLVAAPTKLRTGQAIRIAGRVRTRAAPIPRRGKLVAIQYFESESGSWRPVLVTRTDHGGRFHARYRFRYVTGAARIRLRATALAEERWPYAPGSSAPVTVTVRGR